ncbi:MAG TPA: exonuclease domain-containing protein, partial [Propionibacteriaceae bacterium]|nr:exonuclease domain-containing protein [Propionibacteriaceae bacterium]
VAFPEPGTPIPALKLLAIDLETTGLDPAKDRLLSVGFVPVDGNAVVLAGARHLVIRQDAGSEVGQSATIHRLTDDALASGVSLPNALEATLAAMRGRVLLAHHALVETGFLTRACRAVYGGEPEFVVVDTMQLQYRLLTRGFDDEPPRGALRLWAARGQFGMPRYAAHEALTDALACAELYLAQVAELRASTLKHLL